MNVDYLNADVYKGCSIRGLPIGLPFRAKIHIPDTKEIENEKVVGVFIISTFRNEHECEVIEVLPDHTECVAELKELDSTEDSKNLKCRCHFELETQDRSVQTDFGEIEVPLDESEEMQSVGVGNVMEEFDKYDSTTDSLNVKIEECTELTQPIEHTNVNESNETQNAALKLEVVREFANEVTERPTRRKSSRILSGFVSKYGFIEEDTGSSSYNASPNVKVILEVDKDDKEFEGMQCVEVGNGEVDKDAKESEEMQSVGAGNDEVDKDDRESEGMQSVGAGNDVVDKDVKESEGMQSMAPGSDVVDKDDRKSEGMQSMGTGNDVVDKDDRESEEMQSVGAGNHVEKFEKYDTSMDSLNVKIKECTELPQPVENTKFLIRSNVDESNDKQNAASKLEVVGECANEVNERPTRRKSSRKRSGFVSKYRFIEEDNDSNSSNASPNVKVILEVDKDDKESEGMQGVGGCNDEGDIYMYYCQSDSDVDDIVYKNKKKKKEDSDPDFDPSFDSNHSIKDNAIKDNAVKEIMHDIKEIMHDEKLDGPSKNINIKRKQLNKLESSSTSESDVTDMSVDDSIDDDEEFMDQKTRKRRKIKKIINHLKNDLQLNDDELDLELAKRWQSDQEAEKMKREKQKETLQKEAKKIKVKLKDHPDKYRIDMLESFARKDRAKAPEECAIRVMVCTICEKYKVEHADKLEIHIEDHLNGELHCTDCDFIAAYIGELRKHKRQVHKRFIRVCSECDEETNGLEGFKNHMGKVHNKPLWKCKYCLKEHNVQYASLTKHLYRTHLRNEHPENLIHCKSCNEMFVTKKMLKRHHNSKNGCLGKEPKCYTCEKCGKTYTGLARLKQHIEQVHDNIRCYQCPHCPFTACSPGGLSRHRRVHLDHHPVKCDLCPFTCVQKCQLKSHMRTHTGDKPYKCGQCRYAAAWKVQLKDHLRIHGRSNTVMCDQCHILTKDPRAFKAHVRKEHPQNVD